MSYKMSIKERYLEVYSQKDVFKDTGDHKKDVEHSKEAIEEL